MPCEIRFENVGFSYGDVQVLKNVSFVWKPGEILGIKGPNGSGKSTLLKLMLGLLVPTEGKIWVGGVDLREIDLNAWRRGIAYLPQRPYAPEKATVLDAMRLTAPGLTEEQARRGLEEMGVWERLANSGPRAKDDGASNALGTLLNVLSVGLRQRTMAARVLASGCPIVLMDEPDENLDARGREILGQYAERGRATRAMVVATHDATLLAGCSAILHLSSH
jgi:ATP-binding cassette subfamily C protein CydD